MSWVEDAGEMNAPSRQGHTRTLQNRGHCQDCLVFAEWCCEVSTDVKLSSGACCLDIRT